VDGSYLRVHHFAQQLASPFPLLAAVGARTKKIEIGIAVIDMRYENPHYMAEDAGAADLIAGGSWESAAGEDAGEFAEKIVDLALSRRTRRQSERSHPRIARRR
jgi:hypothetical protein